MTSDPRPALAAFVAALQAHLELSAVRRGENDPSVVAAYNKIADTFIDYEEALLAAYGEYTSLEVVDEDNDDDADDDLEDDDDADDDIDETSGTDSYVGLDDEEYDLEDDDRSVRRDEG